MMVPEEDDKEFMKRLFLENELAMFIAARNIVKDYYIARDMVSESCIVMIKKIGYLREIELSKRTPYIISIVRNNSLMYLRRRKREMNLFAGSQYMFDNKISEIQENVDSGVIAEAEIQMLHDALSKIHKRDSELLKMKYFEKMSDEEIAHRLGIAANSVRFYLTKARRNLASELEKRGER